MLLCIKNKLRLLPSVRIHIQLSFHVHHPASSRKLGWIQRALPICGVTWLTAGFQPCRALECQQSNFVDLLGCSPAGSCGNSAEGVGSEHPWGCRVWAGPCTPLRVPGLSGAVQPPHTHLFRHGSVTALEPSWGFPKGFQCEVEPVITFCCSWLVKCSVLQAMPF